MEITTYKINNFRLFADDYEAHRTISNYTCKPSRFLLLSSLIYVISDNNKNPLEMLTLDSVCFLKTDSYEFNVGNRFLVKVNPTEKLVRNKKRILTKNIDEWIGRKFMDTAKIDFVKCIGKQRYLNKEAVHIAYLLSGIVTRNNFNQLSQNGIGPAKGFGFGSPVHVD
ncbi:hypothetical protein [Leptospira alexanderi]|uniref:hypothetical protein n=1 Tax=Leptospira alexanderi TaxID=100053 RepID=UPI000990DB34|nr:hypothetical protein [Leptospira alexanderi]